MSEDLRVGLDSHTPRPGGWGRLHRRIEEENRRRTRLRRVQTAAAALVVIGLVGWVGLLRDAAQRVAPVDLVRARVGLSQLEAPAEPLTLAESARSSTAIQRVELPTDEVVFYLVGFVQD